MFKKWLCIGLSILLLLSLTACGGEVACDPMPLPEDENYVQGMAKLADGNLTEAYTLLKAATDPKAAEELDKFVFVPTKSAVQLSDSGRDTVTTYTYDKAGRLLEEKKTGNSQWNTPTDVLDAYVYDEVGRVLKRTYRHNDYSFIETYTYNEDGAELTYSYYPDGDESAFSGHVCTYDEKGNLVKQEHFDDFDEAYNYTLFYTYDEQDRLLARTHTGYNGYANVWTYTYDEEGNYDVLYKDKTYTQTTRYNKDGKLIKTETVDNNTGEVQELYEYRYDDKGNEIYRRTRYFENETVHTTTYNELGLILSGESSRDGEVYAMSTYTYDESGNKLTYEYFSGNTVWGRETRTYDEEGHLLTWQQMGYNGWSNYTYDYDEAGNRIKTACKRNDGTTTEDCTYDEWGNLLTFRSYDIRDGAESAVVASMEWQVQYYPDGIPEQVQTAIDNAMSE